MTPLKVFANDSIFLPLTNASRIFQLRQTPSLRRYLFRIVENKYAHRCRV